MDAPAAEGLRKAEILGSDVYHSGALGCNRATSSLSPVWTGGRRSDHPDAVGVWPRARGIRAVDVDLVRAEIARRPASELLAAWL